MGIANFATELGNRAIQLDGDAAPAASLTQWIGRSFLAAP